AEAAIEVRATCSFCCCMRRLWRFGCSPTAAQLRPPLATYYHGTTGLPSAAAERTITSRIHLHILPSQNAGPSSIPQWPCPLAISAPFQPHERGQISHSSPAVAPLLHRTDDGMDRSALPVFPSAAVAPSSDLYRNADDGRDTARRPRAAFDV